MEDEPTTVVSLSTNKAHRQSAPDFQGIGRISPEERYILEKQYSWSRRGKHKGKKSRSSSSRSKSSPRSRSSKKSLGRTSSKRTPSATSKKSGMSPKWAAQTMSKSSRITRSTSSHGSHSSDPAYRKMKKARAGRKKSLTRLRRKLRTYISGFSDGEIRRRCRGVKGRLNEVESLVRNVKRSLKAFQAAHSHLHDILEDDEDIESSAYYLHRIEHMTNDVLLSAQYFLKPPKKSKSKKANKKKSKTSSLSKKSSRASKKYKEPKKKKSKSKSVATQSSDEYEEEESEESEPKTEEEDAASDYIVLPPKRPILKEPQQDADSHGSAISNDSVDRKDEPHVSFQYNKDRQKDKVLHGKPPKKSWWCCC